MLTLAAFAALFMLMTGCSDDTASSSHHNNIDGDSCEVDEVKDVDCNICKCDAEGHWSCTQIDCLLDADDDATDPPDGGDACTYGDTKPDDCNVCRCDRDGLWVCTQIDCAIADPCAGKTCGDVCSTCIPDADGNCPPVMEYCDADGACTTGGDPDCSNEPVCTEGDTQTYDCNSCHCTEDGAWGCSAMGCGGTTGPCEGLSCGDACTICDDDDPNCVESEQNKSCSADGRCEYTDIKPDCGQPCNEGATKEVDCNSCICDANGTWSCDDQDCAALADPCYEKSCGDTCSTCDPDADGNCPPVMEYCNEYNMCTTQTPTCGD